MKQAIVMTLLLGLVLISAAPLAATNGDPLIIAPYIGGPTYSATVGQEVIIRAGWAACNRGLTEAFRNATSISMEIQLNGYPYMTMEAPSRGNWSSPAPSDVDPSFCANSAASPWGTGWRYSLGTLPAGVYDVHFLWTFTQPVPDGGDYDGDGHPDLFSGVYEDRYITIIVS